MKKDSLICIVLLMVAAGCSDTTQKQKPDGQAIGTPDVEKTVRSIIARQLKVDANAINMSSPLSRPPLRADDLDLVEMVMSLEDELGVELPDSAFERYGGLAAGKGPLRITPANLVTIAKEAIANPTPRTKK